MKGVIEFKTSDIDGFMLGMRALTGGAAEAQRRVGHVKALLFGAPPAEDEVRPTPEDDLEAMLAGIPFGLHDVDDERLVRPDWVVTRPFSRASAAPTPSSCWATSTRATSTTRWPPSRRSPTFPGTRWSPR